MLRNLQAKEAAELDPSGVLSVHSIWRTIQGEGPYNGQPAIFVRLAGCNLQCPFCDTDYTSSRTQLHPNNLLDNVKKHAKSKSGKRNTDLIVITGGEPLRQNISPFIQRASSARYRVQIETNGTYGAKNHDRLHLSTVVCSPKTPKIHGDTVGYVDAWKYVIEAGHVSENDGLPTRILGGHHPARPTNTAEVFVQPLDSKDPDQNQRNLKATIESAMRFNYRLCLQVHKIIGLE